MLEIKNLSIQFKDKKVLNQLNLNLKKGEILGILGKNGAGKTTMFECIYQTYKYSGDILWNGKPIHRNDIAYLETENYFYPYITGEEYLDYFGKSENFPEIAEKFSLPLKKFVQDYSHGMKKKLALIGVLYLDKPFIILDEPFNGVDFESVHLIYEIISELKSRGKTLIISSHIIETLFHTCDSIAILENGEISKEINKDNYKSLENFKF